MVLLKLLIYVKKHIAFVFSRGETTAGWMR